jgi:Phytanoyl-CoA dioxygenase (PhyH)
MTANRQPSSLGVTHLEELWRRVTRQDCAELPPQDWMRDRILMEGLSLPLEETLQYLARERPHLADFEKWIVDRNEGSIDPLRIERINATIHGTEYSDQLKAVIRAIDQAEPVLNEADLSFWEENGYVVVANAITRDECRAAETAVWESLKMHPQNPETWYQPSTHGIMRQVFHHPALNNARRSARVHKAFAQIWGTADLWMTIDRVSFNPPEREDWMFPGPNLHWDTSLTQPIPLAVSGLVYLTDTEAQQGAFTCVPGFHRRIDAWLMSLPTATDPRQRDLESLGAVPIAGGAGDLIIWHKALPHGSRPNKTAQPRIAQYVSMHPAHVERNLPWK